MCLEKKWYKEIKYQTWHADVAWLFFFFILKMENKHMISHEQIMEKLFLKSWD